MHLLYLQFCVVQFSTYTDAKNRAGVHAMMMLHQRDHAS